jgi:hypothetical protein
MMIFRDWWLRKVYRKPDTADTADASSRAASTQPWRNIVRHLLRAPSRFPVVTFLPTSRPCFGPKASTLTKQTLLSVMAV